MRWRWHRAHRAFINQTTIASHNSAPGMRSPFARGKRGPGGKMFARKVCVRLKAHTLVEFGHLMQDAVLPWLASQEGFLGMITLAAPGSCEVQVISFWDRERDAQAHGLNGYPDAMRILGTFFESAPLVKTFDVIGWKLDSLLEPAEADIETVKALAQSA
jgi:hypothetical protein